MTEKLQKVLARLGVGSRRELDALIAQGRVEVNGKIATVGERVEDDITVKIDGKVVATPLSSSPKCRVLMYYKPEGELTTLSDPEGRPTVFDHIPKPDSGRWIYIGRLDLNTSGLLLFTTDGELANALMHPKNAVERVYAARIYGDVSDEQISSLLNGVKLKDGMAKFDKVSFQGGDGRNTWYHVSLKEGRNREVRRLWEGVGLKVSRLIRIKYAGLGLDENLKTGQFRELTLSEINNIRALGGLKALSDGQIARTPLVLKERKKAPKSGTAAARPKGRAAIMVYEDSEISRKRAKSKKVSFDENRRAPRQTRYGSDLDKRGQRPDRVSDSFKGRSELRQEFAFSSYKKLSDRSDDAGYKFKDRDVSSFDRNKRGNSRKDSSFGLKVVRTQGASSRYAAGSSSDERRFERFASGRGEGRTNKGRKTVAFKRGRDWS